MMKTVLRWIGRILIGLIVLLLIAAIAIYFRSQSVVNAAYEAPTPEIKIKSDAAILARGEHLVRRVSVCVDCHGEKLEGGVVVDDAALGYVAAPNLTSGKGSVTAKLSDAEIARVLRYGVKSDGRSVLVMPSEDYQHLSDEDLAAIIAYVRSVPPVDMEWTVFKSGPLGRVLLALGQLPILKAQAVDGTRQHPIRVKQEVSQAYGKYLGDIAGCTGCHGPGLSGGPIPAAPPDWPLAANLTPSGEMGSWSEADFINTIRTGVNPAGKALDPVMPWARYAQMSDDELKALWMFISSVPAKDAGNR